MKTLAAAAFGALFGALVLTVQAQPQQPPAPGPQEPAAPAGRGVPPGPQGRGAALPPLAPAAIERAEGILTETRKAMGGDKLTAVRTIVATGRTRRVRGENLVPIEFEINVELPDKYIRRDEVPAEESQPTSTGFVGNEIVQFPLAPAGRGRGDAPPPPPAGRGRGDAPAAPPAGGRGPAAPPTPEQLEAQRAARLTTAKQEFARLMLGLLPATLETFPLQFGYGAQAAAPQGTADVLDVRGPGNFAARLFVASDTKLPIMISWQAPPTAVLVRTPGGATPPSVPPGAVFVDAPAPPAGASPEASAEYTKQVAALRQKAQATPIEYRIYYADYRDVDGVKLPFRLRRAIGADTTEETTFDRFRLNTKIDPRKFAVPK
jgi:hypothetical protein